MHSIPLAASAEISEIGATDVRAHPRPSRRRFYVGLALFMIGLVVAGFWPSYLGPLFRGAVVARPWVIHLHFAVFAGWMALLLTQVILVSLGHTSAHQKVGSVGIGYGFLVLSVGLLVSFAAPILHIAAHEWAMDEAASFLLLPLGDMALFGSFFVAAIFYRDRPEIHKRLILLATVALLFAAAGRLIPLRKTPVTALLVWLSPLLVAMGYDGVTRRRVHPAYLIGTAILLLGFTRVFFTQSAAWLKIGRAMLTAMM